MTGGRNTPPLGFKSGVIVARMPFEHEALGRNQPFILTLYSKSIYKNLYYSHCDKLFSK